MAADLQAIRRGLGAELRTVLPATEGHVQLYYTDSPPTPCLQVVGVSEMDRIDFDDGGRFEIGIEGVLGNVNDRASHTLLDKWIESSAIDGAMEAANSQIGALTKRLLDDGTTQAGQPAACDTVTLIRYQGAGRLERAQTPLLVATWIFEVRT